MNICYSAAYADKESQQPGCSLKRLACRKMVEGALALTWQEFPYRRRNRIFDPRVDHAPIGRKAFVCAVMAGGGRKGCP
jgi:hypothetical protein